MARILVTGMSGTGKSTLLGELARRGHRTVDTDYGGWQLPGARASNSTAADPSPSWPTSS